MKPPSLEIDKWAKKYPRLYLGLSGLSAISTSVAMVALVFIIVSFFFNNIEAVIFISCFAVITMSAIYTIIFFKTIRPAYRGDKNGILIRMGLRETAKFKTR